MHFATASALLVLALGGGTAMHSVPSPQVQPSPEAIDAIGHRMRQIVGTEDSVALLYAEFDDGWVSYHILQQLDDAAGVRFSEGDHGDFGLVMIDAWDDAKSQMGDKVWLAMVYVLDHGKVRVRLLYRGQFDPEVDLNDRARTEFESLRPDSAQGLR